MTRPHPHPSQPTAEQLFLAFRNGDAGALDQLVRQLNPWLATVARRAGARSTEIDEVVQDTWIVATAAAEEFHPGAPLLPWLATLARHRLVSLRRAQRRRARLHLLGGQRLTDAAAPPGSTDVTALERGREALLAVRRGVATLPGQYHDVLHLHLFEDLTPVQIAQRLGLGRVAVRVRLFRGLRRLRRALPDALALLLLAALARPGRSQVPVAAAVTATLAAGVSVWWLLGEPSAVEQPVAGSLPALANEVVVGAEVAAGAAAPELERAAVVVPPALVVRVRDAAGRPLPGVGVTVAADGGGDPLLLDRHASTAADGIATFVRVPAGRLRVQCDRGVSTTVEPASRPCEVELRSSAGFEVRGRVVAGDGSAIGGAVLWLAPVAGGPFAGDDVATTAADGSFVLRDVAPGSFLAVRAAGYAGLSARPVLGAEVGTWVLAANGGAVDVAILDPAGRPVADAVVVVGHRDARTWIPQVEGELPSVPPPCRARSDERGHSLAIGLPPGLHPVSVRSPGSAPFHTFVAVEAGQTAAVVVRLAPGAQLRGRLVAADETPLGEVRVACRSDDAFAGVDAQVAADGTFCFDALPATTVGLLVWARGCNIAERVLTLSAGTTHVDIPVALPQSRRGRIVGAAGLPLPGWELVLPQPEARSVEDGHGFAAADRDGRVELHGVTAAAWERLLMRPPGAPYWTEVGASRQELRDGTFVVKVEPGQVPTARLSARITTADGMPIAKALLHGIDDAGRDSVLGSTDADGRFAFAQVPAGRLRYAIESPRPDLPGLDPFALEAVADDERHYDLVAPAGGRVAFTLQFDDGSAPRSAIVTLGRVGQVTRSARLHTTEGEQVLAPGEYQLAAIGEDFVWRIDVPFTVRAGETTALRLPVRAAAERQFALSGLAAEHRGGALVGSFRDASSGQLLYRFCTPVDQAFPLPLVSYLPVGRILCEVTTAAGRQLRAEFAVTDLLPSVGAQVLPFTVVR